MVMRVSQQFTGLVWVWYDTGFQHCAYRDGVCPARWQICSNGWSQIESVVLVTRQQLCRVSSQRRLLGKVYQPQHHVVSNEWIRGQPPCGVMSWHYRVVLTCPSQLHRPYWTLLSASTVIVISLCMVCYCVYIYLASLYADHQGWRVHFYYVLCVMLGVYELPKEHKIYTACQVPSQSNINC